MNQNPKTSHESAPYKTLGVELGPRRYDIHIGHGLLDQAGEFIAPFAKSQRCFVIYDQALEATHRLTLEKALNNANLRVESFAVPSGEASKSIAQYERLLDCLIASRAERRDLVIALGGGVIGDLAGFVAASLLRGLDFIQIPTTLLSQVDSSVGGKTGINSPRGKNLIGAFHQPKQVLIDTQVLGTLDPRELKAGYAEVVKYGCINQLDFFCWLETEANRLFKLDQDALAEAIYQSCKAKADIVVADETETSGLRSLLNLGHTFGHALEAEARYDGTLLHGEGVSIGICMAFKLSVALGLCSRQDQVRIQRHLETLGMPTDLELLKHLNLDADTLIDHMSRDKKVIDGRPRFILTRGIGHSFQSDGVDPAAVKDLLATYL